MTFVEYIWPWWAVIVAMAFLVIGMLVGVVIRDSWTTNRSKRV